MKTSKKLSVFVVDDDKLFTEAFVHHLEKMFRAETAIETFPTGEECLRNLHHKPDIVILDYYLNSTYPDALNGLQVLRRLLDVRPSTKVIMLSAQDKIEIAVDTIKFGAYDYIIKNDKVFLRTKLVIQNAAHAIADSKELKSYRLWARVATGFILLVIATFVAIQVNLPRFLGY